MGPAAADRRRCGDPHRLCGDSVPQPLSMPDPESTGALLLPIDSARPRRAYRPADRLPTLPAAAWRAGIWPGVRGDWPSPFALGVGHDPNPCRPAWLLPARPGIGKVPRTIAVPDGPVLPDDGPTVAGRFPTRTLPPPIWNERRRGSWRAAASRPARPDNCCACQAVQLLDRSRRAACTPPCPIRAQVEATPVTQHGVIAPDVRYSRTPHCHARLVERCHVTMLAANPPFAPKRPSLW